MDLLTFSIFLFVQDDVFLLTSNAMSYNSADTIYFRQVVFVVHVVYYCIVYVTTLSHALLYFLDHVCFLVVLFFRIYGVKLVLSF